MILERNNLQTVPRVNQILHPVDSLCVHPKIAIIFDHISRAIMALDHGRLGLENKFLENNFAFDKFALQNLANKSVGV